MILPIVTAGLIGYLLGSIPSGVILTRLTLTLDLRQIGSGNIGATNVLRSGYRGLAALTLIGDLGKGVIAVIVARMLFEPAVPIGFVAGVGAVIGHIFPIWLRFNGGKGVATSIGVITVLWWPVGMMVGVTWLAVAVVTRYSSLASLIGLGISPLAGVFFIPDWRYSAVFLAMVLLVVFKHSSNIQRLLSGQESQIGKKHP